MQCQRAGPVLDGGIAAAATSLAMVAAAGCLCHLCGSNLGPDVHSGRGPVGGTGQ